MAFAPIVQPKEQEGKYLVKIFGVDEHRHIRLGYLTLSVPRFNSRFVHFSIRYRGAVL